MPTAERTFELGSPLATVWAFLSDFEHLGLCLPGCTGVEVISPSDADWHMEAKVGFIRKRFVVRTHTTERTEPTYAAWSGESKELSMAGSLALRPLGPDRTEVTYQAVVRAEGPEKQLLNRYFKSRIERDIDEFVRNLRAQLEPAGAHSEHE